MSAGSNREVVKKERGWPILSSGHEHSASQQHQLASNKKLREKQPCWEAQVAIAIINPGSRDAHVPVGKSGSPDDKVSGGCAIYCSATYCLILLTAR